MNSLIVFYRSSIGKKVVMSLTGLFLCLFLVEHLVGNLLLFANDGGHLYEQYSKLLVSNPVIRIIEVVLFASLVGHALSGLIVWIRNKRARPHKYSVYRLEDNTEFASRITMLGGSVIFFFLVVHLSSFFYPLRVTGTSMTAFQLVEQKFTNAWFCMFYVLSLLILAYHLKHGFQSAFQTLGLMHKKYTGILHFVAFFFWFIIPAGFASLPIYFYFFHTAAPTAVVLGGH
jgi:succinate dehydrogenase / fumarate reductase cytochrome b subunit